MWVGGAPGRDESGCGESRLEESVWMRGSGPGRSLGPGTESGGGGSLSAGRVLWRRSPSDGRVWWREESCVLL